MHMAICGACVLLKTGLCMYGMNQKSTAAE